MKGNIVVERKKKEIETCGKGEIRHPSEDAYNARQNGRARRPKKTLSRRQGSSMGERDKKNQEKESESGLAASCPATAIISPLHGARVGPPHQQKTPDKAFIGNTSLL